MSELLDNKPSNCYRMSNGLCSV